MDLIEFLTHFLNPPDLFIIRDWAVIFMEQHKLAGFYSPLIYVFYYFVFNNPFAVLIYFTLAISILFWYFKKFTPMWLLYMPIANLLLCGQIDIFMFLFYRIGNPFTYALITLKPQLFIFVLPEIYAQKKIIKTVIYAAIIQLINFILCPTWVFDWINNTKNFVRDYYIPDFFGDSWIILALVFIILLALTNLKSVKYLIGLFNPAFTFYDYTMMAEKEDLLLIPISWYSIIGNYYLGLAVIPVYLILKEFIMSKIKPIFTEQYQSTIELDQI